MTLKSLGYALVAGIAAFLVVGVTVTELAAARIEFSLFVGLPAGIVVGAAVAAAVAYGLRGEPTSRQHRLAGAVAGFGGGFLAALVVLSGLVGLGVVLSMGLGVVIGLMAAIVSYLRGSTTPDPNPVAPDAD
jgi:hypothetical protein